MRSKPSRPNGRLAEQKVEMKLGHEKFFSRNSTLSIDVLNFWQWSNSDLLTNTNRAILSEFLVASSLDLIKEPRRIVWDNNNLVMKSKVEIEVKSAAKYQAWKQSEPSPISFMIKKKYEWNNETANYSNEPLRSADIYVFCVLHDIEFLNLDNWDFYVLLTKDINERCGDQKTISLTSLENRFPELRKIRFDELQCAIKTAESDALLCSGSRRKTT